MVKHDGLNPLHARFTQQTHFSLVKKRNRGSAAAFFSQMVNQITFNLQLSDPIWTTVSYILHCKVHLDDTKNGWKQTIPMTDVSFGMTPLRGQNTACLKCKQCVYEGLCHTWALVPHVGTEGNIWSLSQRKSSEDKETGRPHVCPGRSE